MAEIFTNNGTSTLNGTITSGATTLVVTSASTFPASGTFSCICESELMTVTGVSGTTFTVTRGEGGTSAAGHASGAVITHILTARVLGFFAQLTAATTGNLTITDGKTAAFNNTLTFTGTDASTVACGAGGTVAYTGNTLAVFAATTSAQLRGVLSDETGTGLAVFATSPTFTTGITINSSVLTGTSSASTVAVTNDNQTGSGAIVLQNSPALTTPALGTPASGTLTNCTIPASAITGTTLASGVTGSSLTSVGTLTSLVVGGNGNSAIFGDGTSGDVAIVVQGKIVSNNDVKFAAGIYVTNANAWSGAVTGATPYALRSSNFDRVVIGASGGMVIGSPTGGNKGDGTLNATAVYDDDVLLTCYVMEAEKTGKIDYDLWDSRVVNRIEPIIEQQPVETDTTREVHEVDLDGTPVVRIEKMKTVHMQPVKVGEREIIRQHTGARSFDLRRLDPQWYASTFYETGILPGLPTPEEWAVKPPSVGELISRLWELSELHTVHVGKLLARISDLEKKFE